MPELVSTPVIDPTRLDAQGRSADATYIQQLEGPEVLRLSVHGRHEPRPSVLVSIEPEDTLDDEVPELPPERYPTLEEIHGALHKLGTSALYVFPAFLVTPSIGRLRGNTVQLEQIPQTGGGTHLSLEAQLEREA